MVGGALTRTSTFRVTTRVVQKKKEKENFDGFHIRCMQICEHMVHFVYMHTGPLVIAINRNPQLLADSAARLMHLRVYDSQDSSRQLAPSPSLCYSLTHTHRSIGYRNRNPQLLDDSAARLMYSRVYDNRDRSHQSAPSPSLFSSLTHAHSTLPTPTLITITCNQVLWFLERLTRPTVSFCETTRTRLTICLPTQPSVCEAF